MTMIFNYGFNQDWFKVFGAYSLLFWYCCYYCHRHPYYCRWFITPNTSLWHQRSVLLWSQVPSSHLPDNNMVQFWVNACSPSTAGEKWHQVALSSVYRSTSISAFSLCLLLLVPSFYSTPLTWCDTTWQMEEAFTENSQAIKSGEGILQLPDTNKHICICSYGRSIYPATHTAQPCICALVPSSRYTRIPLYNSPLQHL